MSDGLTITSVVGAHLTSADRRNVKALIAHGFEPGEMYRVGPRKAYSIEYTDHDDTIDVTCREPDTDDFGRKISRTYRSTLVVKLSHRVVH